jgi:hypothetical protein
VSEGALLELRYCADSLATIDRLLHIENQRLDVMRQCLPDAISLSPAQEALHEARKHLDNAVLELHSAARVVQ